jgi:hypothetical protein
MRQNFAPEAMMSIFHRVEDRRAGQGPRTETGSRLPPGQSIAVIAGLSAVSWAVLISIVLAIRAVL